MEILTSMGGSFILALTTSTLPRLERKTCRSKEQEQVREISHKMRRSLPTLDRKLTDMVGVCGASKKYDPSHLCPINFLVRFTIGARMVAHHRTNW